MRFGAPCRRRKYSGLAHVAGPQDARASRDRASGTRNATGGPALRGPRVYRPAVAVFGRSSTRTRLNSVLSLCAPDRGQRSADDQGPHRARALCRVRNYLLTGPSLSHLHFIIGNSNGIGSRRAVALRRLRAGLLDVSGRAADAV